jgi:hypothetical protein
VQTWEYKNLLVIVSDGRVTYMEDGSTISLSPSPTALEQKMSALGSQGWELDSVGKVGPMPVATGGHQSTVGYWFKRRVPDPGGHALQE